MVKICMENTTTEHLPEDPVVRMSDSSESWRYWRFSHHTLQSPWNRGSDPRWPSASHGSSEQPNTKAEWMAQHAGHQDPWVPGFPQRRAPTLTSTLPHPLSPPPPPASFSSHSSPLGGTILLYHVFSLFTIIIIYKVTSSTELANI